MPRRIIAFVVLAVVLAAVFVRLGVWQLDRRAERMAENARTEARLAMPESSFVALNTAGGAYLRRAFVSGTPVYDREFVVTGRSRNGSPGVHVMTPVRLAGSDTVVLVNRGWIYAPDAATVDLEQWRESTTEFHGYTMQLPWSHFAPSLKGRDLRRLDFGGVDMVLDLPFSAVYLVATDSGVANAPARLEWPSLHNGPHLSYAIQWFCFALIALGGAGIVAVRARRAGGG